MDVVEYLAKHLKTDIAPSPVHGIGTFALRDIEVGEKVFVPWEGDTRIYTLTQEEFSHLPITSQKIILKSYANDFKYPMIWFRLYNDCYWNLANPWVYTNTAEENGNFDSVTKKVIKPIKAGEELFGTYNLENTLL